MPKRRSNSAMISDLRRLNSSGSRLSMRTNEPFLDASDGDSIVAVAFVPGVVVVLKTNVEGSIESVDD